MNVHNGIKIEDSSLYSINRECLFLLLGIKNNDELKTLLSSNNYKVYTVGPKNRIIEEPDKKLKNIQTKFNKLLQQIETPPYVFAGRKKMNHILNAKAHIDCNDMICTDIRKFFPHTKIKYLQKFLETNLKFSPDLALDVANLLTINGHLPTGAPSSPLLTFWSYKIVFDKIYDFATNLGITMTIYIDDMTFSSKSKVSKKLIPFVDAELTKVGLELHPEKLKNFKCSKYKHVTGVCIDRKHRLVVKNEHRNNLLKILNSKDDITQLSTEQIETCIGMIKSMQLIEPKIFEPTLKKLKEIYKLRPKRIVKKR